MTPSKKAVTRVGIYGRVSKAEAKEDTTSIPVQLRDCRRRAEAEGWQVAAEWADRGKSGWDPRVKRQGWEAALAALEAGEIDAILARDFERLLRQDKEGARLLDLHAAGVAHFWPFADEGDLDLTRARDRKELKERVAAAVYYSERLSEKVRSTLELNAGNGHARRTHFRHFGYEWSEKAGTIVPEPDEAAAVKEAARRILAGESRRKITMDWHERGLRTSEGKVWSISRLAQVLRSPTIAALRIYHGEVVAEGSWTPLLDRETWDAVNARLRRLPNGHRGRQRRLLTGVAECGVCGSKLSHKTLRRRGTVVRTYKCPSEQATACGKLSVLAEPVERMVLDATRLWFKPEPVHASSNGHDPATRAIEEALADVDERLRNLSHDHYTAKLIPRDVFLQEATKLRDERADLERELRKAEKTTTGVFVTPEQLASLEAPPENLGDAEPEWLDYWRSAIATVFGRVVVRPVGSGKRFSPSRIELHQRPEYPEAGDLTL